TLLFTPQRPTLRISGLLQLTISHLAARKHGLPQPTQSLLRATQKRVIDWPDEPRKSQSFKLDESFLSSPNSRPLRRKLPLFSDLHSEISRSWKQPFSARLTNAAAADSTNLIGSVEQGYTAIPTIEDTLATHLSPSSAPSWKSRPLLTSKPCRTTSVFIGKTYMTAGQAGMALHTMGILQPYQTDVLKEMDEGNGLTAEAVKGAPQSHRFGLKSHQTHCACYRALHGRLGGCKAPPMAQSYGNQ
ncbi:hypothetical protein ABG768_013285, partial [Culter alburnus]